PILSSHRRLLLLPLLLCSLTCSGAPRHPHSFPTRRSSDLGEWLALDHFRSGDDDWAPDLITFAKGSNSGYVPLGGVILHDRIAASFEKTPYTGGLTYAGHPLACASVVATINLMRDERIVENAKTIGEDVIGPRLEELAQKQ